MLHKIHIPVMGICYTADTPLRVAHYGITSVISLVDDGLLEDYRLAYAKRLGIDVGEKESSREKRIKMYLDFLTDETERKFNWICGLHFDGKSAKDIYFKMLPANSPLKKEYEAVCSKTGLARLGDEVALTKKMQCGEIQANIMVNLNYKDAAIDAVRG